MSVEDGWRNQVKLFGVESLNALDRWRYDMDRLEHERAQARQQVKQEQERHERSLARAGTREEIAALRAELATLREEHESLCRTLSDTMNATAKCSRLPSSAQLSCTDRRKRFSSGARRTAPRLSICPAFSCGEQ
jgi:predicted  nucleic acid-binding Zn-ribbon protein